jgi:hypothetical protein
MGIGRDFSVIERGTSSVWGFMWSKVSIQPYNPMCKTL